MRTIILHYHLFKNAGTSLDAVLKQNFGNRWVTREFQGQNNTGQVEDWIRSEPDAVAFSSHTMMGPLPQVDGVRIVSVMLLRDPIARIKSAYRFERDQDAETFGAVLAKHTDLEGYVKVRLAMPNDRQCRNFQTHRLASLAPGPEPELERAKSALERLTVVGAVSDFGAMLSRLSDTISDAYPDFDWTEERRNVSKGGEQRGGEDPELVALLKEVNLDDQMLMAGMCSKKTSGQVARKIPGVKQESKT
ncbi:sulfotransferase family 2 domain-containing protein [Roseovarius atlanticus]|uniref:sulfotransferase family 2 domain-containing protein n=1 Tax=Roseovarius atlanticus TaxID=1641875 RepID=UPI00070C1C38|nr:sulfotransferase family 2 domain-containing protein [Roseovarius atlanticus]